MPTIDSVIARGADMAPERIAIREWASGRRLTYAQLDAAVSGLARWMGGHGLGLGGTVGIHLPNGADFLIGQFATFRAGGVAAYINHRLAPAEAARQLRLAGARVVITTAAKARDLRDIPDLAGMTFILSDGAGALGHALSEAIVGGERLEPPPGREDCDAIARFTSGTTGAPKGVLVSHRAWLIRAVSLLAEEIQVAPHATTMVLGPLSHQAGLFVIPTFLRLGTLLVMEEFDLDRIAAAFSEKTISCSQMVPTMMGFVLENARAREALRTSGVARLIYGGSPIQRAVLDEALALLPETEFVQAYGSHEAGSISHLDGAAHRHPELRRSAGRPFLAAEVRVRGEAPDGVGEIEVRAPWVPHARITEAGREEIADPWVRTGDVGEIRDGFIYLRDRLNDVIISGGFNVYPLEIEAAIDAHPDIRGSAVVSAPDERWGERVIAFVVPRDAARFDEEALRLHCRQRLAGYKVPKEFRAVAEIPVNVNGKPDRRRLSEPMWAGRARRIN